MTEKVSENGRSQAVRLPDEYRVNTDEWDSFMRAIDMFSDDFMTEGRDDGTGARNAKNCRSGFIRRNIDENYQ